MYKLYLEFFKQHKIICIIVLETMARALKYFFGHIFLFPCKLWRHQEKRSKKVYEEDRLPCPLYPRNKFKLCSQDRIFFLSFLADYSTIRKVKPFICGAH